MQTSTVMALALLAAGAPLLAHAETTTLARSGLWSAYGGTTADNRAVCGVTTVGGDGRRINVEQFAGDTGLLLSLQKSSWAIPQGTQVDLRIQFDLDAQVPSRAIGAGTQVDVRMGFEQSVPFMRALRQDRQIRVFFLGGNEPVWTGGLAGSSRAIDAFNQCRARLSAGTPSQPFVQQEAPNPATMATSPQPPPAVLTQPFGAPPLPGTAQQPVMQSPQAPVPAFDPTALPPIPQAPVGG